MKVDRSAYDRSPLYDGTAWPLEKLETYESDWALSETAERVCMTIHDTARTASVEGLRLHKH